MAFRFSLATLLRLKEIAAEREERLLGQIQGQIATTQQTLRDLESGRRNVIVRREATLRNLSSAAEIMSSYDQAHSIEDMVKGATEQLARLELLRAQQLIAYEIAYRSKELLAGMREDQREVFLQERARREQGDMDDNFSSRRKR